MQWQHRYTLAFYQPSRINEVKVPQKFVRVPGGADGHYAQWVEGAIAAYGNMERSSLFDLAGPLTEAVLMANVWVKANS